MAPGLFYLPLPEEAPDTREIPPVINSGLAGWCMTAKLTVTVFHPEPLKSCS
jgi:hypothetical protein